MALYRVRTKRRKCCNGVNIEPGMEVQVVTPLNNTVQVNNWQYVEDAFMRVFGISLRKANCLNVSDLEITKLYTSDVCFRDCLVLIFENTYFVYLFHKCSGHTR